ncbi:Fc.00g084280.m01.CDS01 [Cosmosporella sp. VM-42]
MTGLIYDAEYAKAVEPFAKAPRPPVNTAFDVRHGTEVMGSIFFPKAPPEDVVQQTSYVVKSYDGAEIHLRRYATSQQIASAKPQPAVLYIHGGGFVAGSVELGSGIFAQDALNSDRPVFAVEYRLAPEHPNPAAVEDSYAALKFIAEHAIDLNIDPARIGVKGESAGAAIATGVALLARDQNLHPPLAKQILLYPMLDDRTTYPPETNFLKLAVWSEKQNKISWGAYIGDVNVGKPDADISPYAVPARAKSYKGLPSTYVDIGTLDIFRNENLEFVKRLMEDDVEVEFHLWPGVPHVFEFLAGKTKWAVRAAEARTDATKSF